MRKQISNSRTCIFTKQKHVRKELIRLVIKNDTLCIDKNNSLQGRGFYIVKNKEIIDRIISVNFLSKKFKIEIKKEFYEELINLA